MSYFAKRLSGLKRFSIVPAPIVVFALAFVYFVRHTDGPAWFHPDELSKVKQIDPGWNERNFNHPQLLLETTRLWIRILNVPPYTPAYVEAGRSVSAMFAALAVAFCGATGYRAFGNVGFLLFTVIVGSCPSLLVYSRFFKEDAALIGGVCFVQYATILCWHAKTGRKQQAAFALLGCAVGITASAKYVGIVAVFYVVPTLFASSHSMSKRRQLISRLVLFFAALSVTASIINHRILSDFSGFVTGVARETDHALNGHVYGTMSQPNAYLFCITLRETHPAVLAIVLCAAVCVLLRNFKCLCSAWASNGWAYTVALSLFAWFLILSMNTIPFRRYALPNVVLLHVAGAIGVSWLANRQSSRHAALAVASIGVVIFMLQVPKLRAIDNGFADDGRQHLRQWIKDNVYAGTKIVADRHVFLNMPPDPRSELGQGDLGITSFEPFDDFCGGSGSLMDLEAKGVKYIVICDESYERYISSATIPKPGYDPQFYSRRAFYTRLLESHSPVWAWRPAIPMVSNINPTIYVYALGHEIDRAIY